MRKRTFAEGWGDTKFRIKSGWHVYRVKVSHDRGFITFAVTAPNKQSAVRQVMAAEKCPLRAIQSIKRGL